MARRRAYFVNSKNKNMKNQPFQNEFSAELTARENHTASTSMSNAKGPGAPLGGIRQVYEIYPGE